MSSSCLVFLQRTEEQLKQLGSELKQEYQLKHSPETTVNTLIAHNVGLRKVCFSVVYFPNRTKHRLIDRTHACCLLHCCRQAL